MIDDNPPRGTCSNALTSRYTCGMGTGDAIAWLRERISEHHQLALACVEEIGSRRAGDQYGDGSGPMDRDDSPSYPRGVGSAELAFMAATQPAWVIRKCDADLRILAFVEDMITNDPYDERRGGHEILEFLAQPYSDHPGFPAELDPDAVTR